MAVYTCSLTVEQIDEALQPFPETAREYLVHKLQELQMLCLDRKNSLAFIDLLMIVLWGENVNLERSRMISAPRIKEIIAEIRHLLWQTISKDTQHGVFSEVAFKEKMEELSERLRFFRAYMDDPAEYCFAFHAEIGRKQT
jgi:hypothetical protein